MMRGRHVLPDHRAGFVELLAEILRGTADLRGAACQGKPHLFDVERQTPETFEAATSLCRRCPVRAKCWQWSIEAGAKVDGITASSRQRPAQHRPTGHVGDHARRVPTRSKHALPQPLTRDYRPHNRGQHTEMEKR